MAQKHHGTTKRQAIPDPDFLPEPVYQHFAAISGLSHPSGGENPVRDYVIQQATALDVGIHFYDAAATEAGKRVIVLRRPGSGSFEKAEPVVLQAHMDMVTVPNDDIFPLDLYRDPDDTKWLRARHNDDKTTLGADDGIGVATILAVLGDPAVQDYPLECLLTVQEETNMGGAKDFDSSLLEGRRYLNLDSETLDTITYGSAGGVSTNYNLPLAREAVGAGFTSFTVKIENLLGGHSGLDINKGRANAVKLLARALIRVNNRITAIPSSGTGINAYDLRLIEIGQPVEDNKTNAIPTRASAIVSVPAVDAEGFRASLLALLALVREQLQPVETTMAFSVEALTEKSARPELTVAFTDDVLCLLDQVPAGVLRMLPGVPGVVETSSNMAVVRTAADALTLIATNRSASKENLNGLAVQHAEVAKRFGGTAPSDWANAYPAWIPNKDSAVLAAAETAFGSLNPTVRVVHAGTECSWAIAKYAETTRPMDCVAIGPTILGAHSVEERLDTTTVQPFYDALKALLHELFIGSAQSA